MTTIQEIRTQYPQYSDLSDKELATALHSKYYSDMPMEDFSRRIGLKTPTTSRADAYLNASIEGGTFGFANKMAAGSRLAEERDLPLSQQTQNGLDLFKEQLTKGQATIDASRSDYPDIFKSIEPIAASTTASLFAGPALAGSLLAKTAVSGLAGGAGSAINESAKPESTPKSIAKEAALGGISMGGAELAGGLVAKLASKLIAPGLQIPYITPVRDKVASFMGKIPGAAREASDVVIDAMPEGPIRQGVATGIGALGTAAKAVGEAANHPLMTNAVLPLTTAIAGPMVSVPLTVLRELMRPGAISRYLAREPLSAGTEEAMRQAITLYMRKEMAPQEP